MIKKNRNREAYSFANINLLGKCNAKCFFCLGEDIPELLTLHNQVNIHFSQWNNFTAFLDKCRFEGIQNIYITGQNTDSLLYRHLEELIDHLQALGFKVGIRTNGYLFEKNPDLIRVANKCKASVGMSIHSLDPETNYKIMGRKHIPDWKNIIPQLKQVRVAIVVNRYNWKEFFSIVSTIAYYNILGKGNIKYVQARRISTDTRYDQFKEDIDIYENFLDNTIAKNFPRVGVFYTADVYKIAGMEVSFWRTVQTSVNSVNYFTDGTISGDYFVVEGYVKNLKKSEETMDAVANYAKISGIPIVTATQNKAMVKNV